MNTWDLFVLVNGFVLLYAVVMVFKYALRRRLYNKLIPSKRLPFIDILGHLSDMPLSSKSRNGLSINTHYLQILNGHAVLFRREKLFCFYISYVPFLWLHKADAVEAFISGTKNNEKNWSYNLLHPWLGTGLVTSNGNKWKSRRKLLTPAFHFGILKEFLPAINEVSQILVKCLQKEITMEFTDVFPLLACCSLDVICETILGVNVGALENKDSQYVKSVQCLTEITMERIINCLIWPDFLFNRTELGKKFKYHLNIVHGFTKSVIQEKKRQLLENGSRNRKDKRKPLMDVLLEHHIQTKDLSLEDIREEVDSFTFAGHDTTAVSMSWALYLIGLHKDVQSKIQEELDNIFESDIEREITSEDISDMKYLDCVLKESNRLYPPVPFIGRNISEDTEVCGYKLPEGASCLILIYQLHRDEDVFPQPEKFDPDRFLPENSVNRHHYAYIPFSAGPRNCIGQRLAMMEEKIVVANILRNYSVHSLDERDKVLPVPDIVLKPPVPLRIKFRPRH